MRPQHDRKPVLIDLIVLVAATAIALAWLRAYRRESMDFSPGWTGAPGGIRFAEICVPFLETYSLAALGLAVLRRPRPRRRRFLRWPGMAACMATALGLAIGGGVTVWRYGLAPTPALTLHQRLWGPQALTYLHIWLLMTPPMVVASWSLLILAFGWRRGSDWLDRLGIVIGVAWLIVGLGLLCVGLW